MEYSTRSRGNTHTTKLARVKFHICSLIMLGYLSTFLAKYTIRIAGLKQKIKASIISGELLVEVFYSVGFHFFTPNLFYTYTITQGLRNVKG